MPLYAAKDLLHYHAATYAQDISRSQDVSIADAQAVAERQLSGLLGAETLPEHELFYDIFDDTDQAIGKCWLTLRSDRLLFVSYIEIDEAQRGKGYGKAAMQLIDDIARERGVKQIWLHVFAFNTTAQAVYQKSGYKVSGIQMFKDV